jgi:hypothetical protein
MMSSVEDVLVEHPIVDMDFFPVGFRCMKEKYSTSSVLAQSAHVPRLIFS